MMPVRLYNEIDTVVSWLHGNKCVIVLSQIDYHKDAEYARGFYGYLLKTKYLDYNGGYELPMQRLFDTDNYYVLTGYYIGSKVFTDGLHACLMALSKNYPDVFNADTTAWLFDSKDRPDSDRLLKMLKGAGVVK